MVLVADAGGVAAAFALARRGVRRVQLVVPDAVRDDDLVVITKGDLNGVSGGTNVLKIVRVGEHILSTDEINFD